METQKEKDWWIEQASKEGPHFIGAGAPPKEFLISPEGIKQIEAALAALKSLGPAASVGREICTARDHLYVALNNCIQPLRATPEGR